MVKVTMSAKMAMASCLLAAAASAETINFINHCNFEINLYHSQSGSSAALQANIPVGGKHTSTVTGPANMFRHTSNPAATLFEISIDTIIWYDISIIVTSPGYCGDYDSCKENGTKTGFNVPMSVVPTINEGKGTCSPLFCAADDKHKCADAYLFPMDNTKTHSCPCGTTFDVTFCYANGDNNSGGYGNQEQQDLTTVPSVENPVQVAPKPVENPVQVGTKPVDTPVQEDGNAMQEGDMTQQEDDGNMLQVEVGNTMDLTVKNPLQSSYGPAAGDVNPAVQDDYSNKDVVVGPLDVRAKYVYADECAGNVPGTYGAVVDLPTCTKEPVTVHSRVGPLGGGSVSLILRGPMTVLNIAVYISNGGSGPLKRVSFYSSAKQTTENMVFMNNMGIDFSGEHKQGSQSYASSDGMNSSTTPMTFNGKLGDALDPSKTGAGPGIATGTEINIMTEEKCNENNCEAYYGENDHAGWKGSLMVFVVEVIMFKGDTVDRPALWMLPAPVMHSGQYGCNCRGMGPIGGCGELDIAEVIETNPSGDKLSTHHYFFDGKILCPGGDNFFDRRYNESTVFITIIDAANAMIKIVEVAKFDFHLLELGSLYDQLLAC